MKALGKHLLLELNGCDFKLLNDIGFIKEIMLAAAKESGATVLGESFHQFSPQGVSGVIIIADRPDGAHLAGTRLCRGGYFHLRDARETGKSRRSAVARLKPQTHSIVLMDRGIIDAKQKAKG